RQSQPSAETECQPPQGCIRPFQPLARRRARLGRQAHTRGLDLKILLLEQSHIVALIGMKHDCLLVGVGSRPHWSLQLRYPVAARSGRSVSRTEWCTKRCTGASIHAAEGVYWDRSAALL